MNAGGMTAGGGGPAAELAEHLAVCEQVLALVTRESESLHRDGNFEGESFARERAELLPRLARSVEALRRAREGWQRLDPAARSRQPEVDALLRENQNLIMKVIVLDRENEQALLRRGLLPPGHLPSSQSQRPHRVAAEYLKNLSA